MLTWKEACVAVGYQDGLSFMNSIDPVHQEQIILNQTDYRQELKAFRKRQAELAKKAINFWHSALHND